MHPVSSAEHYDDFECVFCRNRRRLGSLNPILHRTRSVAKEICHKRAPDERTCCHTLRRRARGETTHRQTLARWAGHIHVVYKYLFLFATTKLLYINVNRPNKITIKPTKLNLQRAKLSLFCQCNAFNYSSSLDIVLWS